MTAAAPASATVEAAYFDGRSARARPVRLAVVGGRLEIVGEGVSMRLPLADVKWPERTRHGSRVARLLDGSSLEAHDVAAWDAWARAAGLHESLIVKAQQNWRATLAAVVALFAFGLAAYVWGVPWLAQSALAVVPQSVDRAVGEAAQGALASRLLWPSGVPMDRQRQVRASFAAAVARADPNHRLPPWELHFATSAVRQDAPPPAGSDAAPARRTRLGPNAFALPGGIVYVTDDLLELLRGRDDVLMGVLAHELGHLKRRHGMRLVVQATLLGAVSSLVWGDFSSLLASVPVLLGQNAYSRDFEREADLDAIAFLRANGVSPAVMAVLFERLADQRAAAAGAASAGEGGGLWQGDLGIALASHPDDAERVRRFLDAAR